METQEVTSKVKTSRKQTYKITRIQLIKFAIGIVVGISIYLITKLIF